MTQRQKSDQGTAQESQERAVTRGTAPTPARAEPRSAALVSEHGKTEIAEAVVAKIAGMAAREIPGVQEMGKGMARRWGAVMAKAPGAGGDPTVTQGVSVEVGERQAAVDLDIVTFYGQSIVDVTQAVRSNVIDRIQGMTGLEVTEVNIFVGDLHIEGEEEEQPSRVE